MQSAFQRSLKAVIPANQLLDKLSAYSMYIDGLESTAKAHGKKQYLNNIEVEYDIGSKNLLETIISSIEGIYNDTSIRKTKGLNVSCGILITRSPEILAQEYAKALETILPALRQYYITPNQYHEAQKVIKGIMQSKSELESELAMEEGALLKSMQQHGRFCLITIFCKDPSKFELSPNQLQAWVGEMLASNNNKKTINIERPRQLSPLLRNTSR